jgi:hypothetical protein
MGVPYWVTGARLAEPVHGRVCALLGPAAEVGLLLHGPDQRRRLGQEAGLVGDATPVLVAVRFLVHVVTRGACA